MKWLWKLLLDQRGEEPGIGEPAGGEPGTGVPPVIIEGAGEPAGQGGEPPATPKFGEFGDDPNEAAGKLFDAFTKTKSDFDNFKTKAGLTERNLGSLRKTLEGSGIRVVEDDSNPNGYRLEPIAKEPKKTRFTDEHLNKLAFHFQNDSNSAKGFLDLLRPAFEDWADEMLEGRERITKENQTKMQQFVAEKNEVESLMMDYFPQLEAKMQNGKSTNPEFNQAFYDRATEIWETDYRKNPLKQLSAAMRAAKELNIIPGMVKKAEIAGYEQGKGEKKILGPVIPKASGKGVGGKWTKEQYLAASEDDRIAYDKANAKL